MSVPQITVVFDPPLVTDAPEVFDAKATDTGSKLNPAFTQANAVATFVNTAATNADASATSAASSASAALAVASAGQWVSGGTYALNDIVWLGTTARRFRCKLAHSGVATSPDADPTHWVELVESVTLADQAAASTLPATSASTAGPLLQTVRNCLKWLVSQVDALLNIPSTPKSAAYTLALADRGTSIDTTAAVTIPANASVAFPVGSTVMVTNVGSSSINISITTDTLRLAGTTTTGTRALAGYGVATLRKTASTTWVAAGAGLT